jgi:hypothetical protein
MRTYTNLFCPSFNTIPCDQSTSAGVTASGISGPKERRDVSAGIEESELEGSLEDLNEPFSLNSSLGFIEAPETFLEDEDVIAHDYYAALSQQPTRSMDMEETLFDNTSDFSDVGGAGIRYEPPRKTSIRFADDVVFSTSDFGLTSTHTPEPTSISENSLDLFESDSSSPDSMSNLSASESAPGGSETDDDEKSEEEDQEKKIIRSMMFAGFGMGLISLLGFGMQKIWSRFSKNDDLEGAYATQVADKGTNGATSASEGGVHGVDAGMQVTDVASQSGSDACNASMNASQMNMSSFVSAPIMPNPGMTGPQ